MKNLGYCWQKEPKGQYVDGHECKDVMAHQQKVYLPFMEECERRMRQWDGDGNEVIAEGVTDKSNANRTLIHCWCLVIWFQDECIFYAHYSPTLHWLNPPSHPQPHSK